MRRILIAALFFFGPALVMMLLRSMIPLAIAWLRARRERNRVIDVTPVDSGHPRWFWPLAFVLGLLSAAGAWYMLDRAESPKGHYVPAHVDEQGRVVPGHWEPEP